MIELGEYFLINIIKFLKIWLICYGFFAFQKTDQSKRYWLCSGIIFIGCMIEVIGFQRDTFIVAIVVDFIVVNFLFPEKIGDKIKAYIVAALLAEGVDSIFYILIAATVHCSIMDLNGFEHKSTDILCSLPGVCVWIFVAYMCRKKGYGYDFKSRKYPFLLACVLISVMQLMMVFYLAGGGIYEAIRLSKALLVLMSCSSLCVLFIFLYLSKLFALDRLQKRELVILKKQEELTKEHYMALYRKNEEDRETLHDRRHFLLYLRECIDQEDYEAVRSMIDGMFASLTAPREKVVYSQNLIVDAVIHGVLGESIQKGEIAFVYEGRLPQKIFISDVDLCALISNALENAKEATLRCESDKTIQMQSSYREDVMQIQITNSFPPDEDVKEIGISKKGEGHGYGIKSMCRIAKAYNGELNWEVSDVGKTFILKILLLSDN